MVVESTSHIDPEVNPDLTVEDCLRGLIIAINKDDKEERERITRLINTTVRYGEYTIPANRKILEVPESHDRIQ